MKNLANDKKEKPVDEIVIVKKYANRRLYNTETSSYITLDDLSTMVKQGRNFEVVDAKTGNDITHSVLAQIIFEEETRGAAMLPVNFLKQLILFYDNSLNSALPHFLEMSMDVFNRNSERWRERTDGFNQYSNPFGNSMNDIQRQNMEMMKKSLAMFNPFLSTGTEEDKDTQIKDLAAKIDELNQEISDLKRK